MTTPDTEHSLAAALAALEDAARAAGVDPQAARREGECLAATVARPAKGAFVDWSEQTGRVPSSQDFMDAASRGGRFRAAPTPTMQHLSLAGSAHAPAYATALADVALAACSLGEESSRVVGNASTAAAAQLGERAAPPVSDVPGALREPVPGAGEHLLGKVLEQLGTVQRRLTNLDLQDVDRGTPGAFDLTGSGDGGFEARKQPSVADAGVGRSAPRPLREPRPLRGAPQPPSGEPDAGAGDRGARAARVTRSDANTATEAEAEAATDAEPEEEPKTVEELLGELDELVGLTEVKAEIHRQAAVLRVEGLRRDAGLTSPTITRHLIFTGNPGTGKTTVARLVAGIYKALGLLSEGQLVEVDRSELVAGYLGQTAMKTAEVVDSAKGGVLFIDEAYALAGDQYGQEAVDTLVKEMEDNRDDLVVIVAGYPVPMAGFIGQNPGLESRFRTTLDFVDYTDDELVRIFRIMAGAAEYDVDDDVCDRLRGILAATPRGPSFGNARFVRNMLEAAIGHHAWRLREVEQPTLEQLRTLEPDDVQPEPLEPPSPDTPPQPTVDALEPQPADPDHAAADDDPVVDAETPQEGR